MKDEKIIEYGLPMWGSRYHIIEDDSKPICGCKVRFWATIVSEPTDYAPCKRCVKKQNDDRALARCLS